jgi:uncharacterized membrane protein YgcG
VKTKKNNKKQININNMKNRMLKTIKLFAIIIIGCICMAGSCNDPNIPSCNSSLTYINTQLTSVTLDYNLTLGDGINVNLLRSVHDCFPTDIGTVTDLSKIVNATTRSTCTGNVPTTCTYSKITINTTSNNCYDKIVFYDDNGSKVKPEKWLYDFPKLYGASWQAIMDFKIETITDIANRSIIWIGSPTISNGRYIKSISAYGIPRYKGSSGGGGGGGSSGGTGGNYGDGPGLGGNHHAFYLTLENASYVIIENASSDYNYDIVDWDNISLISDPNVNTSALSRNVYTNGAYDNNVKWREPYMAVLQ